MKRNTDNNPLFSHQDNYERRFQHSNSNRQLIYDKIEAKRKKTQVIQKQNSINKYKKYDQAHPPRTKTPQP